MAISLCKLCIVFIPVFLLILFRPSLSHRLNPIRCPSHESQALLRFKAAFNDSQGTVSSWVNGTDCCTNWTGISCDNHTNHVVSVFYYSVQGMISESLCQLRFLTSLTISGLSGTTIPPCLGKLSYIQSLDLSDNRLSGTFPPSLCLLTRLTLLNLSFNKLNGSIPSCLGNLSSLTQLDLSHNQLSGSIPASLGSLSLLSYLDLENNQLSGIVPDSLGNLSLLNCLYIANNQLNHYQSITEAFFYKLTSLHGLALSDCVLNISATWIPPFQLYELDLVSCMTDGQFPPWISTQFSLRWLKLTNASLVGVIPFWLWEISPSLISLNISGNHLEGSLPSNTSIAMELHQLDVSGNALSGSIPSIWFFNITTLLLNDNFFSGNIPSSLGKLSQLQRLNLANNLFSGNIPPSLGKLSQLQLLNLANNLFSGNIPPSLGKLSNLYLLNLANNNISGVIPVSLSNCSYLVVLNLGNNSLEGSLPHELSKLSELYSLVVHSNKLNGSFPPSIVNCSKLQVLDIGNNLFEGEIPTLIGNLSQLRVLVMKENNFTGSIPSEIGQLIYLQILLLSSNHISGVIPNTIVFLQAMMIESEDGFVLSPSQFSYQDGLDMTLKGTDQHYTYILSTLTSIDLSNNELKGEVASNIGNLKGLRLLNLSMNSLNGTIPNSLGEMHQLESLDLSRNYFSGQVPPELEFLSSLGSLNLSNNNLSGSIPQGRHITGTFGESSYSRNPNLWGCPLPKNCSWPQFVPPPPPVSINKRNKNSKYPWYEIALGLSYGVAFGGIISLILIKISWRRNYFNKVDTILKLVFPWMENMTL